jgi:hypothetical protein
MKIKGVKEGERCDRKRKEGRCESWNDCSKDKDGEGELEAGKW